MSHVLGEKQYDDSSYRNPCLSVSCNLILDQYVVKNSRPVGARVGYEWCRQLCDGIIPDADYFFYADTGQCRCDFCATQLTNLLFRKQRMKDFLYLTGCESFFSMKRNGSTRDGYLYYCK